MLHLGCVSCLPFPGFCSVEQPHRTTRAVCMGCGCSRGRGWGWLWCATSVGGNQGPVVAACTPHQQACDSHAAAAGCRSTQLRVYQQSMLGQQALIASSVQGWISSRPISWSWVSHGGVRSSRAAWQPWSMPLVPARLLCRLRTVHMMCGQATLQELSSADSSAECIVRSMLVGCGATCAVCEQQAVAVQGRQPRGSGVEHRRQDSALFRAQVSMLR
jgi:hypothetical protein